MPDTNILNLTKRQHAILVWFENRAKADMPLIEWELFKSQTNTKSDLFIEVILGNYKGK